MLYRVLQNTYGKLGMNKQKILVGAGIFEIQGDKAGWKINSDFSDL